MTIKELKAENARLKAEVEAVRQEYSDATNHYNRLHNDLQAQVEMLTKAGDRLSAFLISCTVESRISRSYLNKLDNDWLAAKEGEPRD